jgi:kynurenine formamidase
LRTIFRTEQITATQQMGTHMDGLNHLQAGVAARATWMPSPRALRNIPA